MHTVKYLIMAAVMSVALNGALNASELDDIIKEHNSKKAAAIEKYLSDNPEAKDKMSALSLLQRSHEEVGDKDARVDILGRKYAYMQTVMKPGVQLTARGLMPYFDALLDNSQKADAEALYKDFKEFVDNHPEPKPLLNFVNKLEKDLRRPVVGEDMTLAFTSVNGDKKIDLSKMGDKVVLVDFWATWCVPCVAEIPYLKEAYKKFDRDDFEIVAISLDKEYQKFKSFLKEEGMRWPQHYDGMGWKSEMADTFGITSLPSMFLVKDGKVVATDMRGPGILSEIEKHIN